VRRLRLFAGDGHLGDPNGRTGDRIIDHMKPAFAGAKPPLSQVFERVSLTATEDIKQFPIPPRVTGALIHVSPVRVRPGAFSFSKN